MDSTHTRFDLLKELSNDPPFWFDHALMFCRFEGPQLDLLLEGTIQRPRAGDCGTTDNKNGPWDIQRAVECGLLEPILQSVAEYSGDQLDLVMETLMGASQNFPWMFLAYIAIRTTNTRLVQKCINIIIGDLNEGKRLTNEIGIVYVVWRFLVRAKCKDEWEALLKHQLAAPISHDWTFVHLASAYGDQECLKILLYHTCNQNNGVLRAATELEGFTPLHLAAWYGHPAAVKLLLRHADKFPAASSAAQAEHDVLINDIPRDRIFGRSPLHYASLHADKEVVEILVEKWGRPGVELQDFFGITSLHLSGVALPLQGTLYQPYLLFEAAYKQRKTFQIQKDAVSKDFAMQKAAMARLFLERRRYIDSTTCTVLIPSPRIADGFVWTIQGFTFLHYHAVYGAVAYQLIRKRDRSDPLVISDEEIKRLETEDYETIEAKDCGGLTPSDYARARSAGLSTQFVTHANEARGRLLEGDPTADQVWRLRWVYSIGIYLLSGSYSSALDLFKNMHLFVSDVCTAREEKVFKLDDEVWHHLEWALDKVLQQDSDHHKVNTAPRLHPSDAEEMLLILVQKKVLYGKSPKQRCLQWAITKRMARLAEELVKDTECELLCVVPGGKHEESPLARASKRKEIMPALLTAMELRDDVKRRWFEDRQVYVDYANTLLVGAVLIAGLAFAGWLQPPRGYTNGIIDMNRHTICVFVWSSCLAFFLGMGTVVAGATGAMPFEIGAGQLVSARDKVHKSVVVASMFLVASIICLAIAFSSAMLAILPNLSQNVSIAAFLAVNGLFLCYMLLSFLNRLKGLSTQFWPRVFKVGKDHKILHSLFKLFKDHKIMRSSCTHYIDIGPY